MATWTIERLMDLIRRAADLRAMLGDYDAHADPQLVANIQRRHAAAQHQGRDAGEDPTYDPAHDPYQPYHGPEM